MLQDYLAQGCSKTVVVTAPVKAGVLDIVMGVNHHRYDPAFIRSSAQPHCTTNCLAPAVKVIHESLGIRHGSITTVQYYQYPDDPRCAPQGPAAGPGLRHEPNSHNDRGQPRRLPIFFPELKGKLNGHAIRVPLANASLTDCVFEVNRAASVEGSEWSAQGGLRVWPTGGYLATRRNPCFHRLQDRPRSSIVDALSTMVINGTQVKLYLWYDNEVGLRQSRSRADETGCRFRPAVSCG